MGRKGVVRRVVTREDLWRGEILGFVCWFCFKMRFDFMLRGRKLFLKRFRIAENILPSHP
jgi:hypothetical protein